MPHSRRGVRGSHSWGGGRGSCSWGGGRGRIHVPVEEGGEGFKFLGRREGEGFTSWGGGKWRGSITHPLFAFRKGRESLTGQRTKLKNYSRE